MSELGQLDRRLGARGDRRRDDLLAALDRALRTRRLEDVSVGELTYAAGVTRSAFYFYFDSKAMAVMALLASFEDEAEQSNDLIVSGEGELLDRIRRVLHRLVAPVVANPHVYRAALEARHSDGAVRELWAHDRALLVAPLTAWLTAEQEAGRSPGGTDTGLLADMLVRLNESLLERLSDDPAPDAGPLVETVAQMWVRTVHGRIADEENAR